MTSKKQTREKISIEIGREKQELIIESGYWAKQADGSVIYRVGQLVILASVCAKHETASGQSFFPLSVDYREKFYSAGRIPGSFFRREMRPSEHEVLISRLIDRSLRPLFPEGYLCEVQMIVEVLSYDPTISIEGHAITAASAALMVSDIPFNGPIAGVRIGGSLKEKLMEPATQSSDDHQIDFIIGGNSDSITMIEGSAKEISESEMLDILNDSLEVLKPKIEIQERLQKAVGSKKREITIIHPDSEWRQKLHQIAREPLREVMAIDGKEDKVAKLVAQNELKSSMIEQLNQYGESISADDTKKLSKWNENLIHLDSELHALEYELVREKLAQKNIRADGRKPDQIRNIDVEIDVLPSTHGSAVFTRGQTQALATVTLGTKLDNQRLDTLDGMKERRFLLHYNFPGFSVGELRRGPSPSRREVGHGNLAYRALKNIFPNKEEEFPYITRIVSEILESNGSSSMATVCAGSLALMAAGVPIRSSVAGIAMGLMTDAKNQPVILSDIAGIEDHFGDMDFKLASTRKGITAFQLDLKVKQISTDTLKHAIAQARLGINHILDKMEAVCPETRKKLAANAPCISFHQIDVERIGELIGPGGKMIRMLAEKAEVEINVEDSGMVQIVSNSIDKNEKALDTIKGMFRELKAGDSFTGKIRRITSFGAFVEILPGKEALLHISKMARERVEKVTDLFSEGEELKVRILGFDRMGKIDLVLEELYAENLSNANRKSSSGRGNSGRSHSGRDFSDRGNSGRNHSGRDFSDRGNSGRDFSDRGNSGRGSSGRNHKRSSFSRNKSQRRDKPYR